MLVQSEKGTSVSLHPDVTEAVFQKTVNTIGRECGAVERWLVRPKLVSVKTIQTVPSTKPHKAFTVLQNGHNGILRQTVRHAVMVQGILQLYLSTEYRRNKPD